MLIWLGQETDDYIKFLVVFWTLAASVLSDCFFSYLCFAILCNLVWGGYSFYLQPSKFITPLHHIPQLCTPALNETQLLCY